MITLVTIPASEAPGDLIIRYDPKRVRQYQNMDNAKTYGVDFTARYQGRHFTLGGSYSYLDTEADQYDSEDEVMRRVTIDGMAHHKANWYATWQHQFRGQRSEVRGQRYVPSLGLGLYGRMSSKRHYQTDGDGKGYQIWRFTARYSFTPKHSSHLSPLTSYLFQIEAGVDNIFDYVDRTPHGLHLGTTTAGRTFFASLSVSFNKGKKLNNQYKSNFNSKDNEND
jgi:outer membrane receptor for ferrienterochelin and colicins